MAEIPAEVYEAAYQIYSDTTYGDLAMNHVDGIRAAVESAYAAGQASARAEVAAEIRAGSLSWCMDGVGRHLVENCAQSAEGGPA